MKANEQPLEVWFEENKTQPFTTRDGLGIPTMPLVSTQAVGVEQDTTIHKPAMPPRTFSIADDRIFHYPKAVPATAEGDIEVHGLSLLIAQLLQPSGESPFALTLGPNEDALPARNGRRARHASTERGKSTQNTATVSLVKIFRTTEALHLPCAVGTGGAILALFDDEKFLLLKLLEDGQVVEGADQLRTLGIGLRTLKPPQDFRDQLRMEFGIQGVHDRDLSGLEGKVELGEHMHELTGTGGFLGDDDGHVQPLMIAKQYPLAVGQHCSPHVLDTEIETLQPVGQLVEQRRLVPVETRHRFGIKSQW